MIVTKCQVFILFAYCLIGLNLIFIVEGLIWLELTNDGPATLSSTLNFFATLKGENLEDNYMYRFHDNAVAQSPTEIKSGVNCTYSVHVLKPPYEKGSFTMTVTVFHEEIFYSEVASNSTTFILTEVINGDILVVKDGSIQSGKYFPAGESINLTLHIHDPSRFFDNATLFYVWKIDDALVSYDSIIQHNLTKAGENKVSLTLLAQFPQSSSEEPKWGFFNKDLIIRDRIPRINVTGNSWIPHGKMLNLLVECNGSLPFHYCWKLYPGNKPEPNFTCDYPVFSNTCRFPVSYYIPAIGQYYFSTSVANDVSTQRKSISVLVYDISHVPQLSVTIIPITCIILAIIIVVAGVTYYFHQRKRYAIEIADFDFTESEELIERTFFQRLYDVVKNTMAHSRKPVADNSANNRRPTVNYESMTNCRQNLLDSDISHSC